MAHFFKKGQVKSNGLNIFLQNIEVTEVVAKGEVPKDIS